MLTKHLRGFPVQKKNVHTCARLDGEMAHTYAHLPPNTAHACARLTLVCAHASNHGSAGEGRWAGKSVGLNWVTASAGCLVATVWTPVPAGLDGLLQGRAGLPPAPRPRPVRWLEMLRGSVCEGAAPGVGECGPILPGPLLQGRAGVEGGGGGCRHTCMCSLHPPLVDEGVCAPCPRPRWWGPGGGAGQPVAPPPPAPQTQRDAGV